MYALGIPTTRALAAVVTGEAVQREQMLPGGVVTRVAASHIRVGTFQFFASRGDNDGLRALADHVIERHYPQVSGAERPYLALLEAIVSAQAALIARWLQVGFIHGVMNTDNCAVSGETIDFGPCAFLDEYNPSKVFSSIDRGGRYAYANQPSIGQWNLTRLAETLLPLIDADDEKAVALATTAIHAYGAQFQNHCLAGMAAKIGLSRVEDDDLALVQSLLTAMHAGEADFTLSFRRLSDAAESANADEGFASLFADPATAQAWLADWRARLSRDPQAPAERADAMRRLNPAFIPATTASNRRSLLRPMTAISRCSRRWSNVWQNRTKTSLNLQRLPHRRRGKSGSRRRFAGREPQPAPQVAFATHLCQSRSLPRKTLRSIFPLTPWERPDPEYCQNSHLRSG